MDYYGDSGDWVKAVTGWLGTALLVGALIYGVASLKDAKAAQRTPNQAAASALAQGSYPEHGKPLTVSLPERTKLVGGVSWHCWNGAPCEPWYTTRPMRPGDIPETHSFSNLNGREIILKESGWPR